MLSKFSSILTTENLATATYILEYLRHTANLTISYNASHSEVTIPIGYTDSDFTADPDDQKLISGYMFTLARGAVTWCTCKKAHIAFLIVEAKYKDASDTVNKAIWIRYLCTCILFGKILTKYTEQYPNYLCSDNDSKATEPQQIFVDN